MEKEFNIGDRVMCTDNGKLGVVTEIDNDGFGCVVLFDDGEDTWIGCDMLELSEEPPYDPKTAFLSDLADVLRKHNAVINVGWNDYFDTDKSPRIDMDIMFKDGNEGICFEDVLGKTLTADNIMDYDKE